MRNLIDNKKRIRCIQKVFNDITLSIHHLEWHILEFVLGHVLKIITGG